MGKSRVSFIVCSLVVLAFGTQAGAQAPPKPGPEHDKLKEMVGNWDAVMKTAAGESKGTMTYKMGLGGLWLIEDFKGEFSGLPFEGHGLTTYDPAKKKYVGIWIDSYSSEHTVTEGNFDKEGKVQTMVGEMAGPDGKKMKVTMVTTQKDKDTVMMTMRGAGPDGKDMEMMSITFTRKK